MSRTKKPVGWRREHARHVAAGKGIETKGLRDFGETWYGLASNGDAEKELERAREQMTKLEKPQKVDCGGIKCYAPAHEHEAAECEDCGERWCEYNGVFTSRGFVCLDCGGLDELEE